MKLRNFFLGMTLASLQVFALPCIAQSDTEKLKEEKANFSAACTAFLAVAQNKIPKYKTNKNDDVYVYFWNLGKNSIGLSRFFNLADSRLAPITHEIGQLEGYAENLPEFKAKYQVELSRIAIGADKCINTYDRIHGLMK